MELRGRRWQWGQAPSTHFPELKGVAIKAASTKALLPWIASVVRDLTPEGCSEVCWRRHKCVQALHELTTLLEDAPLFLEHNTWAQACVLCDSYLLNWMQLNRLCIRAGQIRYNIVPKHHYLWNLVQSSRLMNAYRLRTYIHESYIGVVGQMYRKSLIGQWKKPWAEGWGASVAACGQGQSQ